MEALSVGIGLFINMIFTEVLGITAGGMVVPGYIALHLDSPLMVANTILLAFLTFLVIRYMSRFILIYGRRHLMLSILIGFLFGWLFNYVTKNSMFIENGLHMKTVGFIVPGLIAYWMERQGVFESICGLITGSVMTRMILIIVVGGSL